MDECENLVIDLDEYEALDLKQQQHQHQHQHQQHTINDNEVALLALGAELDTEDIMGQAESKKHSKKLMAGEIQTKGTAMSFGFRKNLNTTPKKLKKLIKGENAKKKQDKCNNICSDGSGEDSRSSAAAPKATATATHATDEEGEASRECALNANTKSNTDAPVSRDDNGNAETVPSVQFKKIGLVAANAMHFNATLGLGGGRVNLPGAGNRFGYRGPIRPSSTDITTSQQREANNNVESIGLETRITKNVPFSNLKRRSKSAHAGRTTSADSDNEPPPRPHHPKTLTFNLKQNSTIEYDRRQFFETPSGSSSAWRGGMPEHTIIRPTPRLPPMAHTRFILQTVSLPRPEFAVPISINASTPTTPGSSSYVSSPTSSSLAVGSRQRNHSAGRHPLTVAQSTNQGMDQKAAKHMANSTRRTFSSSREISADSGIASIDMALNHSASGRVGQTTHKSSPKRIRSRPRNLQMVMNGRGRFEVRDLDDSLSSGDSSTFEPLALPKLPMESQTAPLPLSGLVRSNTVLSRESYTSRRAESKDLQLVDAALNARNDSQSTSRQASEEDSESIEESKLHMDRSTTEKEMKDRQLQYINLCSSKSPSPGSSVISSLCNAGESMAENDFSTLSLDSYEDSNKKDNRQAETLKDLERKLSLELNDDNSITINSDMQLSSISSFTEPVAPTDKAQPLPAERKDIGEQQTGTVMPADRPKSICNSLNESKFAEMALKGSTFLLEDETSPTDSLVSSSESEEAACKQQKHKMNEELQDKDIDLISQELDLTSPVSPGTPTHCSCSLSPSDCGNLIDDEIADQPALLCNQESQEGGAESGGMWREKNDTPTLMESLCSLRNSVHSQTSRSRNSLYQAMELSLRTPLALRKTVMERAESLDTLSPCESICSDDLMMDFDVTGSMDSIDRSLSIKSRSGSDLHKIDDAALVFDMEQSGTDVMKEINTLLRSQSRKSAERDITAHLPARATRLLNRSRMQQHPSLNNDDSDRANRSPLSPRRRTDTTSSRNSTASSTNNNNNNSSSNQHNNNNSSSGGIGGGIGSGRKQNTDLQRRQRSQHSGPASASSSLAFHQRGAHTTSDDFMLYDKSFRNAMIQDVLQFKKQLLRLRKILQETETLNPFENDNQQLFTSCGLDSKLLDDIDLASLTSSITDDPIQELSDLRRQVVYLQGQVDDRDRTIRMQKDVIEQLEADRLKGQLAHPRPPAEGVVKESVTTATQTDRIRPLSMGTESLARLHQFGDQK